MASAQPEVDLEVTGAEAKGALQGIGAFSGLLHERGDVDGLSTIEFELVAKNLTVLRDSVPVVAAGGVVVPVLGAENTSKTLHQDVIAKGFAREEGQVFAVLPKGPVSSTVSVDHVRFSPATGRIESPVFVESGRSRASVSIDGSAELDAPGAFVTLEGSFVLVFWEWMFVVEDADGVHEYRSGRLAYQQGSLVPAGHGEMVQHVVQVDRGILRLQLPDDRPSGLFLHGSRWSAVETVRLQGALGAIGGRSLNGQDVTLEGKSLDLKLAGTGADYIPVRVTGDILQAHIAEEKVVLGAASGNPFKGPIAWIAGAAVVAIAALVVARAGKRGPYNSRWLNLSEQAFERAWARPMLLFANMHLRRDKRSSDGWKLKTNALQAIGRARPEIKAREAAARFLLGTHRVHNAMRLVILHARCGDVDAAMVWLRRCKQMDPQGTQRLGISELAADLGRDARFRAAAGQVLGLDPLGT